MAYASPEKAKKEMTHTTPHMERVDLELSLGLKTIHWRGSSHSCVIKSLCSLTVAQTVQTTLLWTSSVNSLTCRKMISFNAHGWILLSMTRL